MKNLFELLHGQKNTFQFKQSAYRHQLVSIERQYRLAEKLGITMTVVVVSDAADRKDFIAPILRLGADRSEFAASINKLLIAASVLDTFQNQPPIPDLVAMLQRSSNTAAQTLVKSLPEGPVTVNRYAAMVGLKHTALYIRPNGTWHLGTTSASDGLTMLQHLLRHPYLSSAVTEALATNTTRYGVRTVFRPRKNMQLFNKTGDYNGEDDEEVGYAVRHDVGMIKSTSDNMNNLLYAITTRGPNSKVRIANQLVYHIGANILEMAGGAPLGALGRLAIRLGS